MATIEPRLIHLLNDSTTPELSNTDLPPFHSLPLPNTAADRPLPPLDRDASHRGKRAPQDSSNRVTNRHPAGEDESTLHLRADDNHHVVDFVASADVYPLRMLLRETDAAEPQQTCPPKIPDDTLDGASDDAACKKRNRPLVSREDYLQLPQPVKKPKPAVHASVFPPIINGLHEPPPEATLFPPIASNSFRENESGQLTTLQDTYHAASGKSKPQSPTESDKASNKARKRATKPRRKWSEEETNHLLLGVSKHGVGKWTTILEDSEFRFNERSAGDLKDRFRTCCPAELRASKAQWSSPTTKQPQRSRQRKGLYSENILHNDADSAPAGISTPPAEFDPLSKQKRTRAHRKKLEDLENLGIHAPFKKSLRRERRPFTEQDDQEILQGLEKYGPAWTKIQRDPTFHLSARQPTDLRDRVRNRYPSIYQRIEKGTYQAKDAGRGSDVMEPSVTMCISNSFHPSNQGAPARLREDVSRTSLQVTGFFDRNQSSQSLEMGEPNACQWPGSEMGISRLLLDDSR